MKKGCSNLGFLILAAALSACSQQKTSAPSAMSFQQYAQTEAVMNPQALQPTSDCDETCQNRRLEFRYVVYVGKQIYCYWDEKKAETGTDFDALAKSLESSITSANSQSEYYLVLRRWASAFHDGHVNVMTTSNLSDMEIYTAPIRVEVLAPATDHEKVVVTSVSGSVALSVGDEITAINGVSIKDALTQAAEESSSGSTERMRRYSAGRRLVDVIGIENGSRPFVVTVKPISGGAEKAVALFRNIQIDAKPSSASFAEEETGARYITARILPNSIGYLRLDAFIGSQDDYLIREAMNRLSGTRGLIVDLRKNGGGDLSGDRIIERLITKSVIRYKRSERVSDYLLSQRQDTFGLPTDDSGLFVAWHDLTVKPVTAHRYDKPVVVLISPYCFSACDTFSASLKANHLATFIGEPTGGGTGTPLVFELPYSPFLFRYSVVRGQDPEGVMIEGRGTSPDVYLEPTAFDRASQRDTQLEKAISVLESLSGSSPQRIDLSSLPKTWEQSLERSPTREENDFLLKVRMRDEI